MPNPNFFSENSPFLQHPLLTPERTAREIEFVIAHLGLSSGERVLDVGCGFGRHSIELAKRGYAVTGIDPAAAMIEAAQMRAAEAGVNVTFEQTPAETFTTDQPFEAAICLFTTLGQVSISAGNEQTDNIELVAQVYSLLKSGGKLLIEVSQREPTVQNLKPTDRFGTDDAYTDITRRFNAVDNTLTETFTLVSPANTQHFLLRYRLFSLAELTTLTAQTGFKAEATYCNYHAAPLQPDSPTMLLVCCK